MNDLPNDVARLIIEWQNRAISCLHQAADTNKGSERQRFSEVASTFTTCADELHAAFLQPEPIDFGGSINLDDIPEVTPIPA